jgi:hypothetical protein
VYGVVRLTDKDIALTKASGRIGKKEAMQIKKIVDKLFRGARYTSPLAIH